MKSEFATLMKEVIFALVICALFAITQLSAAVAGTSAIPGTLSIAQLQSLSNEIYELERDLAVQQAKRDEGALIFVASGVLAVALFGSARKSLAGDIRMREHAAVKMAAGITSTLAVASGAYGFNVSHKNIGNLRELLAQKQFELREAINVALAIQD